MKTLFKTIMTLLRGIRRSVIVLLLLISVGFNIAFFVSDTLLVAASGVVSAVSGTRTILARQADDIVQLEADLKTSRQAQRQLRGELDDTAAKLAQQKLVVREVRSELAETAAHLTAERVTTREIRGQLTEASAELVMAREATRRVRAELGRELADSRAVQQQMRAATSVVATRIARRNRRAAARELSVMPAEAVPVWGTAIIVAATAVELNDDLCQTLIDMTELQRSFSPDVEISEEQLTVCSMEVPSRAEIWERARNSPGAVWSAAQDAMPSMDDIRNMELPDFDWAGLGRSISDSASGWSDTVASAVWNKWNQIKTGKGYKSMVIGKCKSILFQNFTQRS